MPDLPDPEKVEPEDYVDPEVVAHADDSDDTPCFIGACGTNAVE